MMDETDPLDHNPICHNKQLGPEFPEVARCWCKAEQGRGKAAVPNPSDGTTACCGGRSPSPRTLPKLEIALPQRYSHPGAGA